MYILRALVDFLFESSAPKTRPIAKSILEELRSGREEYWKYIPDFVNDHSLTYNEAIEALHDCLNRNIPEYEKTLENDYSSLERLREARKALESIENGDYIVSFRGRSIEFPIDFDLTY